VVTDGPPCLRLKPLLESTARIALPNPESAVAHRYDGATAIAHDRAVSICVFEQALVKTVGMLAVTAANFDSAKSQEALWNCTPGVGRIACLKTCSSRSLTNQRRCQSNRVARRLQRPLCRAQLG